MQSEWRIHLLLRQKFPQHQTDRIRQHFTSHAAQDISPEDDWAWAKLFEINFSNWIWLSPQNANRLPSLLNPAKWDFKVMNILFSCSAVTMFLSLCGQSPIKLSGGLKIIIEKKKTQRWAVTLSLSLKWSWCNFLASIGLPGSGFAVFIFSATQVVKMTQPQWQQ